MREIPNPRSRRERRRARLATRRALQDILVNFFDIRQDINGWK